MMYVDDIQLYITCDGDHVPTGTIEECEGEICNWMTYMLTLNDRKREVIHLSSKFYGQGPITSRDLQVAGVSILPSNATCNSGIVMDSAGIMLNYVSKLWKSALFTL